MVKPSVVYADVPLASCVHSRFNTRKTRSPEQISKLAERIRRNGFEPTRALWVVPVGEQYEVFAGGTRLEAARQAGLTIIPVMIHKDISEEEIARRADEDNENDEYHAPVGLLDVWAEYHRLWKEEGWTQQRIADAKDCSQSLISERIKWHDSLPASIKSIVGTEWECRTLSTKMLTEKHLREISVVYLPVDKSLNNWLTTEQAQTELVQEVLSKHRGKTAGEKPNVKNVRERAQQWKAMIALAEECLAKLTDERWQKAFAKVLAKNKARTQAEVNAAFETVNRQIAEEAEAAAEKARQQADQADEEARQKRKDEATAKRIALITAKVCHGDSRKLITTAPAGFHLLLTDPPYGMDYQSQRRRASPKKDRIANDDFDGAVALLSEVLTAAYPHMAEHATLLLFTGWRHEPKIREVIEQVGFTIKGSLIWHKHNHGTGDLTGSFAPKHERILHAVKGSPELLSRHPDVLSGKDFAGTGHPTEKPLDLLRTLIEATTSVGQVVVDPFAGTGNTLLTALELERDTYGIELDESYYRITSDRLYQLATREAVND